MNSFRELQDKLGWVGIDGVAITLLTYMLSPREDKIRNSVIIGGVHGVLHYYTCKVQSEDRLI